MSIVREVTIAGKTIRLEFGKYAKQANASVMVSCGDTQVLVTVCAADEVKEGQDFFPLTVDYFEKFYSAGRIPGGFFKREAKPTDRETLTARVIDRPLRPCFPDDYKCDTFVTATVVSFDPDYHPAPLALLGASTALMISDIPFNGPVASIRIGLKDGEFVVDPPELEAGGDLDLNIAARPGAILMVEAGANFLSEEKMLDAIDYGYNLLQPLFDMQYEIQKELGQSKREIVPQKLDEAKENRIKEVANSDKLKELFRITAKKERYHGFSELFKSLSNELNPDKDVALGLLINECFEEQKSQCMRSMILDEKQRIDGRGLEDIRKITCEVGVLKRPHGSALFTRGETQSLGSVTLGAAEDGQRLDSVLSPDITKRFMLHYNFPPYSVGEARPSRSPGRREIGHGNLAEKALLRVIPEKEKFGYTIRLVSEILESNGSSSMASVCAGTLALLGAGVPISEPVAGIAMGLVKADDKFAVLSDILGDEDHLGDMDFKVCGGDRGITALQMDIKVDGLSREILAQALDQAKRGRAFILGKIKDTIKEPAKLSDFAPRIFNLKIKTDRIKDLIGPGGKNIKRITAETGVKIDIADDGTLSIVSPDIEAAENAKKLIKDYTSDPEVGQFYLGTVKKVVDFGAFVEIKPGVEGLCHVSQLDFKRVENVHDYCKEGDEMLVKLIEIDQGGRLKLSRKEALEKK